VRETVFNWLSHLYPGVGALRGLDLFAGTGALGFELASRGAARVVLVERDPLLAQRLTALRDRLGALEVEVIRGDALEVAGRLAPASFDLIFVDPPYHAPLLRPALKAARALLAPGGAIYAEAETGLGLEDLEPLGLQAVRAGRAGRVHFHLLALQQS
jgi:16S rRNA (guanine966-N2)-methyltransferase